MINISKPFIQRPVMTILVTIGLFVFGIASYLNLPVRNMPEVAYPIIEINTFYPGASADTMANNVATPLEGKLMGIKGIKHLNSVNRQSFSQILVQFHLNKNMAEAETDVQTAISQAMSVLPADLPVPPSYKRNNPNDKPVLYIAVSSNDYSEGVLYDYAKANISRKLSLVDGVSNILFYGAALAYRIEVDLDKIYLRGLTIRDIKKAVRANNVLISSGLIRNKTNAFVIKPEGQLFKKSDYENIIISNTNNNPIYVKDVAKVIESNRLPSLQMANLIKGKPRYLSEVIIAPKKTQEANTIEVAANIEAELEKIKKTLPANINAYIVYSNAKPIISAINDIQSDLVFSFILIILVTFVFFGRARNTIIPVIALPLSLFITFICMRLLGFSLDNLSLLAITVVMGFLVDDAIVLLENTMRHIEEGLDPVSATLKSAKEISFTIFTITMTLAILFIPVLFLPGQLGRVFQEFSVTLIIAVVASGLVALIVTPTLCTHFLKSEKSLKPSKIFQFVHPRLLKLNKLYLKLLTYFLEHRAIVFGVWAICVIGTVFFVNLLPKSFLPAGDSSYISGIYIVDEGTSYEQHAAYHRQIEDILIDFPDVAAVLTLSGIPMFLNSNMGIIGITVKEPQDRTQIKQIAKLSAYLEKELMAIPGIMPMLHPEPLLKISTGITSTQQGNYAYTLSGIDTKSIYSASENLLNQLRKEHEFKSVSTGTYLTNPEIKIDIKRQQAASYGVTAADIEFALFDAYSQNYDSLILSPTKQTQVIVQASNAFDANMSNINQLYIRPSHNPSILVPFEEVASTRKSLGPLSIGHTNGLVSQTIFFNLNEGVPLSQAITKLNKIAAQNVPSSLNSKFEGKAEQFISAFKSFGFLSLITLLIIYIILGSLYQSYFYPLVILATFPTALIGAFFSLYICGVSFTLYGFLGCFLLLGLIQKNGILIVDFALEFQRKNKEPAEKAILEACKERFRPILMTTAAAIMGALPLALSIGSGGAATNSLGIPVVGGLLFSQLVTLFVIPVFFLSMHKFHVLFTKEIKKIKA